MLFIDDDQPQIAVRQKQRRPRPDHNIRVPLPNHPPATPPFRLRHAGMPFRGPLAKACFDPVQKLARQRDLWQQHQGLPPGPQASGDSLQINLGLARPGHTFQQGRAIGTARHSLRQHRGPRRLICR